MIAKERIGKPLNNPLSLPLPHCSAGFHLNSDRRSLLPRLPSRQCRQQRRHGIKQFTIRRISEFGMPPKRKHVPFKSHARWPSLQRLTRRKSIIGNQLDCAVRVSCRQLLSDRRFQLRRKPTMQTNAFSVTRIVKRHRQPRTIRLMHNIKHLLHLEWAAFVLPGFGDNGQHSSEYSRTPQRFSNHKLARGDVAVSGDARHTVYIIGRNLDGRSDYVSPISELTFIELLKRPEGPCHDFKRENYKLSEKKGKADFLKDVLSMTNTPRNDTSHIVLGVDWTPEAGADVVGLDSQIDDAEFATLLDGSGVVPIPTIVYTPLTVPIGDGTRNVGILSFPISSAGPSTSLKDLYDGSIRRGTVYYRNMSSNAIAVGGKIDEIRNWFSSDPQSARQTSPSSTWQQCLAHLSNFETVRRYVLVVDRLDCLESPSISGVGLGPWSAVIDFDSRSESDGLLSKVSGVIRQTRNLQPVFEGDVFPINPENGTHWFFANGQDDQPQTVIRGSHRDWVKAYKRAIAKQLAALHNAVSPAPTTFVFLGNNVEYTKHMRTIAEEIDGAFGDSAEIILIRSIDDELSDALADYSAELIEIGSRGFCIGLMDHFKARASQERNFLIPTHEQAPLQISEADRIWMEQDFEIVYLGGSDSEETSPDRFYRGAQVSWRNLQLRHDCERNLTSALAKQVSEDLSNRHAGRINLYHEPGAGGTTVAKRVMWESHTAYPCVVLRNCNSRSTFERLTKLTALSGNSVLVLVEGAMHIESKLDELYDLAKGNHSPILFLQVLRQLTPRKTVGRSFYLPQDLVAESEGLRFQQTYSAHRPDKTEALKAIVRGELGTRCTPFYFCLTALEGDFHGLPSYVGAYISELSDVQRKVIQTLAFAHYFGQTSLSAQFFANTLGLPSSKTITFARAFDSHPVGLHLVTSDSGSQWRTIHYLVAEEVLKQTLGAGEQWEQGLSKLAIDFAQLISEAEHTPSEASIELLRRIYVYRGNSELLGSESSEKSRFSHLVERIPSRSGQQAVLNELVELFPDQPHFFAHLARFLAFRERYTEAITAIKHAVELSPSDHNLHHVLGMVYRYQVNYFCRNNADLAEVIVVAERSSEAFQESRKLNAQNEHAFIAEIQMTFSVLKFSARLSKVPVSQVVVDPEAPPFVRGAFDAIENLLADVRNLRVGQRMSTYEEECRTVMNGFYDDFPAALEGWNALLNVKGVAKPRIRRQIVWTLYNKAGRSWGKLDRNDVDRCRRHLEKNLSEEPNDESSLRLWLQSIRYSPNSPPLQQTIEKIAYWYSNTASLSSAYYLFVLTCLDVLEGNVEAIKDAERNLTVCRGLAAHRRDRHLSLEWLADGKGISALVNQSDLGNWEKQFWSNAERLLRISGRIKSILGPQKGYIILEHGLEAFFVPSYGGFQSGRDENARVTAYLGFMYDGLRAWEVERT